MAVVEEELSDVSAKKSRHWLVYMIETRSGKLYTGITTDLDRRFRQHLGEIKGGARFFHSDPVAKVVFREHSDSRSAATRREMNIKKLTRSQKLLLVAGYSKA